QNLAPVPMRRRPAAIQQTGPRQRHRPCADRADPANSPGNLPQPAHYFRVDFVALDRIPTSDKQSVNLSAQFAKRLMRDDPKSAVGHQQTSRRCGYDFDRVYRLRSRIFAIKEVGSARKNLERSDQVENLDLRRGHKNDSTRRSSKAD